jgi:hypothetical protein
MKKILFILAIISITTISCKDSKIAQLKSMGKHHIIKQYGCDGKIINRWESTGNVSNEEGSDGWYFEDNVTKTLVEVTGTITIEVIE